MDVRLGTLVLHCDGASAERAGGEGVNTSLCFPISLKPFHAGVRSREARRPRG